MYMLIMKSHDYCQHTMKDHSDYLVFYIDGDQI